MSYEKDGGPAYPIEGETMNGSLVKSKGMSLRDYFAAKAMQGYLASFSSKDGNPFAVVKGIANGCYQVADAMLRAREQ